MSDANILSIAGAPLQGIVNTKLVQVYLLQQIAGAPYSTMTANELNTNAAALQGVINPDLVTIYLLEAIASGTGAGGFTPAANYGGVAPNVTPGTSFSMTVDTSNGRVWLWYNGIWQ